MFRNLEGILIFRHANAYLDAMLKLRFVDNSKEPFWVMEDTFTIGSGDQNNLTIENESISERHAQIINKAGKFFLKDLGSQTGTLLNGESITRSLIAVGDILSIGKVNLEIVDPLSENSTKKSAYWSLIADSSWLSGQEFPLKAMSGGSLTIGRGADCDLVFPGTHLSRTHAVITLNSKGSLTLKDLSSANGTYVNNKRITETEIHPGDKVRFDLYSFKVFGPGIQLSRSATAMVPAITDTSPNKAITDRQWESRPTSPGNREEIDLYKKNRTPIILASIILALVVCTVGYALLNIFGLLG